MHLTKWFLQRCCIFAELIFIVESYKSNDDNYNFDTDVQQLIVTQDGPVTLDIPITFTAILVNGVDKEVYRYLFEDDTEPPHKNEVHGSVSVQLPVTYEENAYKPGYYSMKVSCYRSLYRRVAVRNVTFQLTRYIHGKLDITGISKRYDKMYSATGRVVNMSISLELPSHILNSSELSYSWTLDKDKFITSFPYYNYQFKEPGSYDIHVTAVARIPIHDSDQRTVREIRYKWGYFNQEVEVKIPFNAINLTGNTYLKHGQLFDLEVSCNGSGPFEYCWKVLHASENVTNLTCLSPVVTTKCSFPIIYYLNPSGNYRVAIFIDNFVSSMQRNVDVHIYDVSLRPQLSTVILPLFCSVLVIFIIAGGVMLHVRRNQQFDIETADFDFLQSEAHTVETFWERWHRSVRRLFGVQMPEPRLSIDGDISSSTYESVTRY